MRRSAELIRKTEQENEKRRQTAQELAVDILMRKSGSEEKRQAAESLADYRRRMLGKPKPDPTIVQVAKKAYPNLPEDKAIQAYLDSRKAKPSEPRLTETEKLAALRAKQKRGQPLTLEEQELLNVLNDKANRTNAVEEAIMKSLGLGK
jgi:hypothetical protein